VNPTTDAALRPATHSPRIHYIDWLRVLAVLLLFPFHVSRVFNSGEPFYVKDAGTSAPLGYVLWFIDVWHMPLLFFLAGASTHYALRKRSGGSYLLERVKRLLVPFLFGFLVLIPPQTWLGGRFNSDYTGSFFHYLASGDFLVWNVRDGGDYFGGFGIGHLWFILMLFLLSIFALPFFLGGRTVRGTRGSAGIARLLAKRSAWLLAAFFIMIGEALPDPSGGLAFFYNLAFFVLGYLAFADQAFAAGAARHRRLALGGGVALTLFWILSGNLRNPLPDPSFARAGLTLLGCLATWLMIVGLLGYGRRYLDRTSPALGYLAEGSYPIYILHQTVIVVIAFYLVSLPGPWPLHWVLLFATSVAGTFALYEVIRRLPVRVLLGMRLGRASHAGTRTRESEGAASTSDVLDAGSIAPPRTAQDGPRKI